MKGSSEYIEYIDLFGLNFSFSNRYKSKLGGIFTLIFCFLSIFIIFYYVQILKSEKPTSIYSYVNSNTQSELKNLKFEIQLNSNIFEKNEPNIKITSYLRTQNYQIPLRPKIHNINNNTVNIKLNYDDFDLFYRKFQDEVIGIELNLEFLCENGDCESYKNSQKIKDFIFNVSFIDTELNLLNYKFRSDSKESKFNFRLKNSESVKYKIKLREIQIIDDENWIQTLNLNKPKSITYSIDDISDQPIGFNDFKGEFPLPLLKIDYDLMNIKSYVYVRSFTKITEILNSILTLLFLLFFIIKFAILTLLKNFRVLQITNSLFEFYSRENNEENFQIKKILKSRTKSSEIKIHKNYNDAELSASIEDSNQVEILCESLELDFPRKFRNQGKSTLLNNHQDLAMKIEITSPKIKEENHPETKEKGILKKNKFHLKVKENEYEDSKSSKNSKIRFSRGSNFKPKFSKSCQRLLKPLNSDLKVNNRRSSFHKFTENVDETLILINSKHKLDITLFELVQDLCCCSKFNSKNINFDFLKFSDEQIHIISDSRFMLNKLIEIEKLKQFLLNDHQIYCMNYLTFPVISNGNNGNKFMNFENFDRKNCGARISKTEALKYLEDNYSELNMKIHKMITTLA